MERSQDWARLFRAQSRPLIVLLLVTVGASLSFSAFLAARQRITEQAVNTFRVEAAASVAAVRESLDSSRYPLDALRSFWLGSENVTRSEFASFAAHLLAHSMAIHTLSWVPLVPGDHRERFEENARKEGVPGFRITEMAPGGELVSAAVREEYFPLFFVAPSTEGDRLVGYDLGTLPFVAESLRKARETGMETTTGNISLFDTEGSRGFFAIHPFYRGEGPLGVVGADPGYMEGLFIGAYRFRDLLGPALLDVDTGDINVHLYDGDAGVEEPFLFSFSGGDGTVTTTPAVPRTRVESGVHISETVRAMGRDWVVVCTPSEYLPSPQGQVAPWGILAVGFFITALVAGYVSSILLRVESTRRHIREVTAARDTLELEVEERRRVEAQLDERVRIAELDADIGRIFSTEATLAGMLQKCVEAMVQHFNAAFARVWLLNEAGDTLELRASAGMYTHLDGAHGRIPIGKYKIGLIAAERQALHTNSVIGDERIHDQDWARREGITAFAGYPLVVEDRLIGVVALFSRQSITDISVRAIASSANLIAVGAERKRSDELLRAERDRAQSYLDLVGVVVLALDVTGQVTLVNRTGIDVLGLPEEEIIGRDWFQTFVPEALRDRDRNDFNRIVSGRNDGVEYSESSILDENGKERIIAWHTSLLKGPDGIIRGTLSSGEDITDRKRMEEDLLQKEKLESLGILAGGIAHDFNNLLTAIMGNISLAKIQDNVPSAVVRRLGDAETASERARSLTQQLLTFSKGGAPIRKNVPLGSLIEESCRFILHGSNVLCVCDTPEDTWHVLVDEGQMTQVVNNLIINADQAMPEGGRINVRCENTVVTLQDSLPLRAGNYVKITIRDSGTGISAEHLPRIFDPYFTLKETGSGLGLATVYSIIRRHDGHITVDSKPGSGTTFCLYLPAAAEAADVHEVSEEPSAAGRGKILLMDDEEMVRDVAGAILAHLGYDVAFAANGAEALEKYGQALTSSRPFDAVIMDLTVPGGMGGKELILRLREIDPGVKGIVSSGYSHDPVMSDFRESGFRAVIAKPYTSATLGRVLLEVLGNRRHDTGSA